MRNGGIRFIEVNTIEEGNTLISSIQSCDNTYNQSVETTQSITDPNVFMYWVVIWEQYDECVSEVVWESSVPYKEGLLV